MKVLIDQWNGNRVAAKWDGEKYIAEPEYEGQVFGYQQRSPEHIDARGNLIPRWLEQDIGGEGPGELPKSSSTPVDKNA